MADAQATESHPARAGVWQQAVLSPREHRRIAELVRRAVANRTPIEPLTASFPELGFADACCVRDMLLDYRIEVGERPAGIAAVHEPVGVPHAFTWLTDRMLRTSGAIDTNQVRRPCVVARLGAWTGGRTADAARVVPCLELVDVLFTVGPIQPSDGIAANGGTVAVVIGEDDRVDARGLRFEVDGRRMPVQAGGQRTRLLTETAGRLAAAANRGLPDPTLVLGPPLGIPVPLAAGSEARLASGSGEHVWLRSATSDDGAGAAL